MARSDCGKSRGSILNQVRSTWKGYLCFVVVLVTCQAWSQEIYVHGGTARDTQARTHQGTGPVTYLEDWESMQLSALPISMKGTNTTISGTALPPDLGAASYLLDRRLSLAAGIGPYAYFDTDVAPVGTPTPMPTAGASSPVWPLPGMEQARCFLACASTGLIPAEALMRYRRHSDRLPTGNITLPWTGGPTVPSEKTGDKQ